MNLAPSRIRAAVPVVVKAVPAVKPRKKRKAYQAFPLRPHTHDWWVTVYPDAVLEKVYWELRIQNLRDYEDEEVRWKAQRLQAVACERRFRIKLGEYAFMPVRKARKAGSGKRIAKGKETKQP